MTEIKYIRVSDICFTENEKVLQDDCNEKQERMLELFEELGIYIKRRLKLNFKKIRKWSILCLIL